MVQSTPPQPPAPPGYPPPPQYPYPPNAQYQMGLAPHRGGAVLALGILGLVVCLICGIIAWVMGNNDLREMDAGRMDPSGRGITQAGKICGMIGVILQAVVIFLYLLVFLGAAAAGGF